MRKIIYYVASSIDGYISGLNDDVSGFVATGNGVDKYLADLANFDSVIMGRNTYEFGNRYGLTPGAPVYPNMKHFVFSGNLKFDNPHPDVQVKSIDIKEIEAIQNENGTDIYLCGGGQFAGWLLDNQKIDFLKLKLNPLIVGEGTKLFGNSNTQYNTELLAAEKFDNDLQIMTCRIEYKK